MKKLAILIVGILPLVIVANPYKPIKEWQDVAPFAGRFVAYQELNGREQFKDAIAIDDVMYGYVRKHFGSIVMFHGFILQIMVPPAKQKFSPGLIDIFLSKSQLHMRVATIEEVNKMKKCIQNNQAVFSYYAWKPMGRIYAFNKESSLALIEKKMSKPRNNGQ